MNPYRCASEPAGGVGCRNSEIAGVELVKTLNRAGPKSAPKKCRIWALVGACGVGASGSTVAMTKGPLPADPVTLNLGGPAVAEDQ
jgi:hypothetical protein